MKVVIEFDDTIHADKISEVEIKQIIDALVGSEVVIDVEIIEDEDHSIRVVVSVADEQTAQVIVDAINEIINNKHEQSSFGCSAGVLCSATNVFVVQPDGSQFTPINICVIALCTSILGLTSNRRPQ